MNFETILRQLVEVAENEKNQFAFVYFGMKNFLYSFPESLYNIFLHSSNFYSRTTS